MQHKLLRPLLILAAVPGLALLLIVAAELSARFEPVTAAAPAPDGEYVRLQADARLFTLFAALNAGGYDEENNEQGAPPIAPALAARIQGALGQAASQRGQFAALSPVQTDILRLVADGFDLSRGRPPGPPERGRG